MQMLPVFINCPCLILSRQYGKDNEPVIREKTSQGENISNFQLFSAITNNMVHNLQTTSKYNKAQFFGKYGTSSYINSLISFNYHSHWLSFISALRIITFTDNSKGGNSVWFMLAAVLRGQI